MKKMSVRIYLFTVMAVFSCVVLVHSETDNFLVTLKEAYFLNELMTPISKSNSTKCCEELRTCKQELPDQALKGYVDCNQKTNPTPYNAPLECRENKIMYPGDIGQELYDCLLKTLDPYTPEEIKMVKEYEACVVELAGNLERCRAVSSA